MLHISALGLQLMKHEQAVVLMNHFKKMRISFTHWVLQCFLSLFKKNVASVFNYVLFCPTALFSCWTIEDFLSLYVPGLFLQLCADQPTSVYMACASESITKSREMSVLSYSTLTLQCIVFMVKDFGLTCHISCRRKT